MVIVVNPKETYRTNKQDQDQGQTHTFNILLGGDKEREIDREKEMTVT